MRPFHYAFSVTDLEKTRSFYLSVIGCTIGRETDRWIDFNFFGHQITAHLGQSKSQAQAKNPVDGDTIEVPHFGLIMTAETWHALAERIQSKGIDFLIAPRIRFEGQPGEQGTFFIKDPSANTLEFKYFDTDSNIFAS